MTAPPAQATRPRAVPVAMVTTFVTFMALSLQIRGLGELVSRGASPLAVAGMTQLLQGTVTLILILSVARLREGARTTILGVRSGRVPWWTLVGGLAGALQIAVMGLVSPLIGVAALTVLLVSGQTANGLLVDRVGLTPGGPRPVTATSSAGERSKALSIQHTGGAIAASDASAGAPWLHWFP